MIFMVRVNTRGHTAKNGTGGVDMVHPVSLDASVSKLRLSLTRLLAITGETHHTLFSDVRRDTTYRISTPCVLGFGPAIEKTPIVE